MSKLVLVGYGQLLAHLADLAGNTGGARQRFANGVQSTDVYSPHYSR